jgi:hypothetical protein
MGFKEFMDQNGKFITETEAQARVQEMKQMRERLLQRLAMEKQYQLEQQQALAEAHQEDVREDNVHTKGGQRQRREQREEKRQQQQKQKQSESAIVNAADPVAAAAGGSPASR